MWKLSYLPNCGYATCSVLKCNKNKNLQIYSKILTPMKYECMTILTCETCVVVIPKLKLKYITKTRDNFGALLPDRGAETLR